jgi:hypothetical protein
MANPPGAAAGSEPLLLPFSFAGRVIAWNPTDRYLEIGVRTFRVASSVRVASLVPGVDVTVAGYVERPTDSASRWVVTKLIVS